MASLLKNMKLITLDYWLMLAMLFVMKVGQFMMFPFLAIYLSSYAHASAVTIGVVVGAGAVVYAVISLVAGLFVDRYGVRRAIAFSLFFSGIILYFFFYNHSVVWFFIMSALTGATRSFFDVGFKSYKISEATPDMRRLYFSLRFSVVNSAAAVGPVLGAYLATSHSALPFKIVGVTYIILCVISIAVLQENSITTIAAKPSARPFRDLLCVIKNDNSLLLLLSISIIIWMVYSQLDSTLAQYLYSALPDGVRVYSLMLIINAVGCASLQVLVTQASKSLDERTVCIYAMTSFAAGYFIIAFSLSMSALVLASLLIVLAETLVMPLNDLLVMKIAPANRIGTYYGAMGLAMIGLGIGPMVGGCLYSLLGPESVFVVGGLLCLVTIIFYQKLLRRISISDVEGDAELSAA
tara:strand:- start:7829 stop:9055 length:1227 start_codon:yes stop_codon:yes gene_type:complete